MENSDLVSVIVPIYKVEDDLEKCINSITEQTYRNLEIILVDDGSPDRCGEIADEFAKKDSRIKVIHKTNGGLSDARNAGMDIMQGEYVTFVDSDDYIDLNLVDRLLSLSKKHDAEVAICNWAAYSKEKGIGRNLYRKDSASEIVMDAEEAVRIMFYQKIFEVTAWGKLYTSEVLKNIRYPKGLIHEDTPTTHKAMMRAQKVVYTSEPLYKYQIRPGSIENEKFNPKKMDGITTAQMMLDDIVENYPQLTPAAQSRYIALNIHVLAQIKENRPERLKIIENIKKVRRNVLFDKSARMRVRGACALTYLGFRFTTLILNIMNQKKYF